MQHQWDLARLALQGHDTALVADGRVKEKWRGERCIYMLAVKKSFLSQATFCLTVRPKQQVLVEALIEPYTHTAIGNTRELWAEKSHNGSGEDATGVVRVQNGA